MLGQQETPGYLLLDFAKKTRCNKSHEEAVGAVHAASLHWTTIRRPSESEEKVRTRLDKYLDLRRTPPQSWRRLSLKSATWK